MQNISKIYETTNVKEVNKKLQKGWLLLEMYAKKNCFNYVLGKRKLKSST